MDWQLIETAPKNKEVIITGENGAVCLGIYLRRHPYIKDGYLDGYSWQIEGQNMYGIGEPEYWMPKPKHPTDN